MMPINTNYCNLCRQILDLDPSIRFAAVATSDGKILATQDREGIKPLLSMQESALAIMQSLMRMSILRVFEQKLGKTIYSITACEKIESYYLFNEKEEGGNDKYSDSYLMVSFEKEANVESIINEKILPLLLRSKIKSNSRKP